MKRMKTTFAIVCLTSLGILGISCTTPTQPVKQDCELHNTGTLHVTDGSLETAQRIVLDGTTIGVLRAGESLTTTVSAGTTYTLEYYIANTNRYACTPSLVATPQCYTSNRQCNYP